MFGTKHEAHALDALFHSSSASAKLSSQAVTSLVLPSPTKRSKSIRKLKALALATH